LESPPVYDPFSAAIQQDPYPAYDWLLAEAPVYHNERQGFWALTRFADVHDATCDWRRFSSAAGVRVDDLLALAGPSFITMDPPRHDVLRAIVRPAFQPRTVAQLEPIIAAKAQALLAELPDGAAVDLAAHFAKRLPALVICELMGLPESDAMTLKAWADDMLQPAGEAGPSTTAARTAAQNLRDYFGDQLARRRREPGDDLIGRLVSADLPEPLTADEEIGMCNLLFEAGNSTTTSLIGNGILALARHPGQRDWLAEHPDAMPAAVEELLRYDSPVQNDVRMTTEEVELHGTRIPAGAVVILVLGAANRDPGVWPSPGELQLEREQKRNLAFGAGIHHCVGAPLARLEGRVALRMLLTVMPRFEVLDSERLPDVTLRMLKRLTVSPGRPARGQLAGDDLGRPAKARY
jgi:cytochrome P450